MKVKFFPYLIITLVVILFDSCNKDNEMIIDDESLIFNYHRSSGWTGLDENLKITTDSTYYSIHHDLAEISYQTSIKTSKEQWDNLTKAFDLKTFTKIQDESCGLIHDIPISRFSVTVNGEIYSFYNGDCDKYYKQMQSFFDSMVEQIKPLRDNIDTKNFD
jgi:hypothetical protein